MFEVIQVPRSLPFYEFDAGERVWPIDRVYGGPLEFQLLGAEKRRRMARLA